MRSRFNTLKFFYGMLLSATSLLFPVPVHADGPAFSAGLGFEFASGRYGTGTRTESVYMPFTAAVNPTERLGFSLEIPYLYQSTSAVNTTVFSGAGGQTMHARKAAAAMSMGDGSMSSATTANPAQPQNGIGDIIARGGYVLVPEGDLVPRIRPYVQLKIPTADSSKALGTGEFDEGFAVELFKRLGQVYTFAEAGYTHQGKSRTLALKDYLTYNAGGGYAFGDKFLPMLIVKGSTAPVAGSTGLLEVRLKLRYLATSHTGVEGYLAKGITTNSPDYGSGLALFHDF